MDMTEYRVEYDREAEQVLTHTCGQRLYLDTSRVKISTVLETATRHDAKCPMIVKRKAPAWV
jgi:hypothetical protein